MPWLKWDAEFCDHPQVVGVDWRGRVYFWQLCSVCKRKDFRGTVPKAYASEAYIASQLPGIDPQHMLSGKMLCEEAGLTRTEDDGSVVIDGWRRRQTDPTGAKRQADWRARQKGKTVTDSNALRGVTQRDTVTRNDRPRPRPKPRKKNNTSPQPPSKGEQPRTARQARKEDLLASVDGLTDTDLDERFDEMVRHDQEDRAIALVNILARAGHPWAKRKREELR